ncbi:expressed unknown protein [Seminavis robusta]|uniref:Uncharacterized protein n=1 Tax=Seminavis robusta TaxID=568900 RepID=A0A9N8EJZ5_9STRA|nr:expressed unknown protein [Seminavis robusta]|eukprot:Sro1331_g263520.1 n/a (366) ;mRNA; f:22882-24047
MDDHYVQTNILNIPHLLERDEHLTALLEQTLAIQGSNILNVSYKNPTLEAKRLWNIRLHYMALHIHQHLPALPEARARQDNPQAFQRIQQQYDIGNFDFECRNTNYLVANILNYGIGADVYWSMIHAFKAGMAVQRVVHFVNQQLPSNVTKNKDYRAGWQLASCPRKDYQCTFCPPSPCVPTIEDLHNGYQLNATELQGLYKEGTLPTKLNNTKVVFAVADEWEMEWISLSYMKHKPERNAQDIMATLMDDNHHAKNNHTTKDIQRIQLLRKAAGEGWRFGRAAGTLHTMMSAYTSYSLRPLPTTAQLIWSQAKDSLPRGFDPHQTVGLPIRATDKCHEESECLTFSQHMDVVAAECGHYFHHRI